MIFFILTLVFSGALCDPPLPFLHPFTLSKKDVEVVKRWYCSYCGQGNNGYGEYCNSCGKPKR